MPFEGIKFSLRDDDGVVGLNREVQCLSTRFRLGNDEACRAFLERVGVSFVHGKVAAIQLCRNFPDGIENGKFYTLNGNTRSRLAGLYHMVLLSWLWEAVDVSSFRCGGVRS